MAEGAGLVWVALGAAVGGPLRLFLSEQIGRRVGGTFPFATLCINGLGSLGIGLAAALLPRQGVSWSFVAGGLLGSFTTVSSLSLHTLELARERAFVGAGANVVLSLVIGLAAVAAGFAIGQLLAGAAA